MDYGAMNIKGLVTGEGFRVSNPRNLLKNSDFEDWNAGTTSSPDGWAATLGAGASVAREATIVKSGSYSCKLVANNATDNVYATASYKTITYWKGRTVTLAVWVYCDTASCVKIGINDGVGETYSDFHTGGSGWELLKVTRTLSASATQILVYGAYASKAGTIYIDAATLNEGSNQFAYAPFTPEETLLSDYSLLSTIVGWASFTSKKIYVKKIGKTVIVQFYISGTSNASGTTFTVPYAAVANPDYGGIGCANCADNGTSQAHPAMSFIPASSTQVTVSKDFTGSGSDWTNSGTKRIAGTLVYEAA
jgi:hypothetical protein